ERKIIENPSEPVLEEPILIEKTPLVISELENWKKNIAPSHLVSYLYDPIQFYIQKVLKINEVEEVEEELSQKSYGNLVHYSLEFLYGDFKGKTLVVSDLENKLKEIDNAIDEAIRKLKHQPEFYERGMNYIQKSMAKRTIEQILGYDLDLVKSGKSLEIIDLERRIEDVEFVIDAENNNIVKFKGFIDRIDKLDGVTRIIDYKTGKASHLTLEFKDKTEKKLCDEKYKPKYIQFKMMFS
ncbi:MAG: PD-(D/E)XK nuclease family protein, partial [Bergeyella zoohelcum]|nr:PD-(D/E)XK nuclease family protein [Bergeyella zoohelcum]